MGTRLVRKQEVWRVARDKRSEAGSLKANYRRADVCDAKRLKVLEDENEKLKQLLADQMLETTALKALQSTKW